MNYFSHPKEETIEFNPKKNTWHWFQVTIACLIKIVISIIAVYLSWDCSSKSNIIIRALNTI